MTQRVKEVALTALIGGAGGAVIAAISVGAWGGGIGVRTERNESDIKTLEEQHKQDVERTNEKFDKIMEELKALRRDFDRHDARQSAREGR